MKLSQFCISRPVFTIVLNILMVTLGIATFFKLEVRDLPKLNRATVSIQTTFEGASPESVETEVTNVIEDALSAVQGLDSVESTSLEGSSNIVAHFKPNYDIDDGFNSIRDKVNGIIDVLPESAMQPQIQKADDAANATLFIAVSDAHLSKMALTDYVAETIKPKLEQISGVARVQLWGAREYSIRISPKPLRMAARGITINDIEEAISNQNVSVPGGIIQGESRDKSVLAQFKLQHVRDFQALIIKQSGNNIVHLSDVATVELLPKNDRVSVTSDGKPTLVIAITPQTTANPVSVSAEMSKRVAELQQQLPVGMKMTVNYDRAVFIKASIHNVYRTLFEAIVLVVLVVSGFLGSLRGALIAIITIPICMITTFSALYYLGFSINTMTLLAMVLAIGLVVDDAIVMIENVYRHMEDGLAAMSSANKASSEIGFAIIAMTLTLVTVYLPIAFTEGIAGDVFTEFALCLAAAVLVSGVVALTLTPMLCAKLLSEKQQKNAYQKMLDNSMHSINRYYESALALFLNYKTLSFCFLVLIIVIGYGAFQGLPSELAPTEDSGTILTIINAPTGVSKSVIQEQVQKVDAVYTNLPEKSAAIAVSSVPDQNKGIVFLVLKPWEHRARSQHEIVQALRSKLWSLPGALIFPIELPVLPTAGNDPLAYTIQLSGSYEQLATILANFKQELRKEPGIVNLQDDLRIDSEKIVLSVDRALASELGIPLRDIAHAVAVLMGGRKIGEFDYAAKRYDIRVQLDEKSRSSLERLNELYFRTAAGAMVPFSNLITVHSEIGANKLMHYNRLRSVTLRAGLADGLTQGQAINIFESVAKRVLPDTAKASWAGQTKDYLDSAGSMALTIALACVFIYLVLSAQFESFRDPFIILVTVPFSIVGAVLMLNLMQGSVNIYTQIGFLTLIGLITKHGILITEFANQLRRTGIARHAAILQAASSRLRPILMTTGAMVLGGLPLIFSSGAGAYARQQLGYVIVGGLSLGSLMALFVVPLLYCIISKTDMEHDVTAC